MTHGLDVRVAREGEACTGKKCEPLTCPLRRGTVQHGAWHMASGFMAEEGPSRSRGKAMTPVRRPLRLWRSRNGSFCRAQSPAAVYQGLCVSWGPRVSKALPSPCPRSQSRRFLHPLPCHLSLPWGPSEGMAPWSLLLGSGFQKRGQEGD